MHHWTTAMGICLLFLLSCATATLQAVRRPASRTFISTVPKSDRKFSVTQVKNPNWKPYSLSTTEVYAAPFLKHKRPMPEPLRAAWNRSKSRGENASTASLAVRNDGQHVN